MNKQQATERAKAAVKNVKVGDPEPIADMTVLFKNDDGSFSVCDNGEEVVCQTEDTAVRVIVENLT